jgi:hypothetical protein
MATATRKITVKMEAFPPTVLHDTPATKQEIDNIRKFVEAIEDAAQKFLYEGRSRITIKEHKISARR